MNLKDLVDQKRQQTQQEKIYLTKISSRKISKKLKDMTHDDHENELRLGQLRQIIGEDRYLDCLIKAVKENFGDPMNLIKDNMMPYSKPYWNPTHHTLTVASLGLIDEQKTLIIYVKPGERVMIPYGYTIGGKNSAVYGVAPQLKPFQDPSYDATLDISPTSFLEWCTFGNAYKQSKCCAKQIVWSDYWHRLSCFKCGARC